MARGVDHYVFLAPCSAALANVASQICTDPTGFNRKLFHRKFNAAVVAFFRSNLSGREPHP